MASSNSKVEKRVFDSEEALAVSLAKYIADLSHYFAQKRGLFTVVLSGGSMIQCLRLLFPLLFQFQPSLNVKFFILNGSMDLYLSNVRKLVEPPYVDSIDWSIWHIFWLDERVVPKTHVDSNYKLAYDGFLSKVVFLIHNCFIPT